jgi:hypothetical protein
MHRIENVITFPQGNAIVYLFVMGADTLLHHCKVDRFGDAPDGVNRKLDEAHALEIAEAMADHSVLWLENVVGVPAGRYSYDESERTLTFHEGAYISLDNGQHRQRGLELLNQLERDRLSFPTVLAVGLSFEERLRLFRQQRLAKGFDSRLDLAQRHRLGDWKNPGDREAYEVLLKLDSDPSSPLRGKILLEEQVKRPHEGKHRPIGINGNGLYNTVRSVIGKNSPLHALSPEKRCEVVMSMIRLAAATWSSEWESDKHILTTARGINAVLMLLVSSANFRGQIGNDFSQESLRRGLEACRSFKWAIAQHKNASIRAIVERLNQSIGRGLKAVA